MCMYIFTPGSINPAVVPGIYGLWLKSRVNSGTAVKDNKKVTISCATLDRDQKEARCLTP